MLDAAIGPYTLLHPLGQDRLGDRYLATDTSTGHEVALCLLHPALVAEAALTRRLRAVVEAVAGFGDPGVARPVAVIDGPRPCLVSEQPEGAPLSTWLAVDPPAPLALPPLLEGLAESLRRAHQQGLWHGGLNPRNLIVRATADGAQAVICDLGVESALLLWQRLHPGDELPGPTPDPRYRAPGLPPVDGEDAAYRAADVFALGAIFAALLRAQPEREATAPTLTEPGRNPAAERPRDLRLLLQEMQAADPAARPTLDQVLDELRRLGGTAGPALSVRPGMEVAGYRLVRRIGGGGMGVIFEGVHTRLSRRAAIKVLRPEIGADPKNVARFFTEAESVNVAHHPGIVNTFEFGRLPDGTVFIVMELLDGSSLHDRLEAHGGRLGLLAVPLLRQVASTLRVVHERGIVHRDLKPENLMIVADPEVPGGERVKILDFGLAKMAAAARGLSGVFQPSQVGQALGTPLFMSPEQCRDAATVDGKADVYSLGVILYMALLGRPPFLGRGFAEIAAQHLYTAPPSVLALAPELPAELAALVERMLAKDGEQRPDMGQVAAVLERLSAPQAATAPGTTGALGAVSAPRRRQLGTLGALLGGLLVAGIGAVAVTRLRDRQPPVPLAQQHQPAPPVGAVAAPAPEAPDLQRLRARALLVLGEGLRDADPAIRRRAAQLLGQSREVQHAVYLLPLLRDLDPDVQAQAAASLAQLGARGAVPALLLATDPRAAASERGVRLTVAAAAALSRLGEPAGLPLLRRLTRARDPEAQRAALLALMEHGDRAAQRRAEREPVSEGLISAWGQLARSGDRGADSALHRLLDEPPAADPARRLPLLLQAAEALARTEDAAARRWLEESARPAGPHAPALTAQPPLLLLTRRTLAGLDDPRYCDSFAPVFSDTSRALHERLLGAEGVGACGRPQSAPLLGRSLPREQGPLRLRLGAAAAILQIAASDPSLLMRESLYSAENSLEDERWGEREAATLALGDVEPVLAVPLLGRAIRDERPEVRQSAARALGRTRTRAAVPVLGGALDDDVRTVRREVMNSIGKVGRHLRQRGERVDDIVGTVSPRAGRGEDADRLASVTALIRLGDTSHREQLQAWLRAPDPEVRRQAIEAWSADPDAPTGVLVDALRDPVFTVRFAAAARLVEHGAKDGAPVLREALRGHGPEAVLAHGLLRRLGEPVGVAAALPPGDVGAVAALARLPLQDTAPQLARAAADPAPAVRREVVAVLAERPADEADAARSLLRGLLGDPDRGVRTQAGALLARLGRRGDGGALDAKPVSALDRAQAQYMAGNYAGALALARAQSGEQALVVEAASACRLHDAPAATAAYARLVDLAARRYVGAVCQRAATAFREGVPEEEAPLPPPPPRRAAPYSGAHGPRDYAAPTRTIAAPSPGAATRPEKGISNKSLVLPDKVHGQVKITE